MVSVLTKIFEVLVAVSLGFPLVIIFMTYTFWPYTAYALLTAPFFVIIGAVGAVILALLYHIQNKIRPRNYILALIILLGLLILFYLKG